MKKFKSFIACVASLCIMSTFAFSVAAAEGDQTVNGPADSLGSVTDIAGNIIAGETTTTAAVTTTADCTTTEASYTSVAVTTTEVTVTSDAAVTSETTTVAETTTTAATTTTAVVKYTNDIVIGLDISGSMSGEPMTAMKEAAIEFCKFALDNDPDARIAIVSFDSSSKLGVSLTNDLSRLTSYISGLSSGSTTNFTGAFDKIMLELESGSGTHKNVVFMADGLPNVGKTDTSQEYSDKYPGYSAYEKGALKYDNENMKPNADIYTVGFFHKLTGNSKDHAVDFMKELASDSKHYYNADIDSLKEVFIEISDDIVLEAPEEVTQAVVTEAAPAATQAAGTTTSDNKTDSTPKTSDSRNAAPLATAACVALAAAAATKKKKN